MSSGGAKIDVKNTAIHDQRGHRFHPCILRLLQASPVSAEVDNLDGIAACIQRGGNTLFSRNTNGATGVVESGSALHDKENKISSASKRPDKQTFPEVPPRTEYALTDSGLKLLSIINQIRVLDEGIRGEAK